MVSSLTPSSAQPNPMSLFALELYICPEANPTGPEKGRFRVFRGGGWHTGPYCSRVCFRNALPSNWVDFAVGFRCVKDAADEPGEEAGD